ncbi:MAG TPA: helix-turn-helix domain-containing protein [Chloroflexota bacterium]|nr:helix-turn-helix domain-containing protein [Chloroflexota bacterium]
MSDDRLLYSRKDAAAMLSISVRTLHSLISSGRIRAKRVGSRKLIPKAELEKFVKAGDVDVVGAAS